MDAPRTRARDLGVPGLGRGRSQLALIAVTDFTVWLGSGAIMPYLPVFLREQAHASLTLIALIAAAYFAGVFALSGWFGHLSDRVGRRPMIIAGTVLYAVATALFLTTTDPVWFIVFRFVEGAGTAAVVPAAQAFIADITVDGNRGRAYGWLTSAQFCGLIAGPALAWPLYALGGGHGRWAFSSIFVFGAALTAAVAVVLAVLLREPQRAPGAGAASTASPPARVPLRALLTRPVVAIVVVVATAEFSMGAWEVVWSLWLRHIGAPMRVIGLTWIAFSLPMAFSFAGGRLADRSSRYALMVAGFAILALSYVPFALTHDVRVYLVAMLVGGAGFAVGYPAKQGFLVRVAAPGRLGAVQGVEQTAMQLAALAGTLTAPPLYGLIGGDIFALAGVVSLAGLAVAVPMLRREWACVAEAGVDGVRSCADLRRLGRQGGLATELSVEAE